MFVIWGLPYGIVGIYDTAIGQGFLSSNYPKLATLIPDWLPTIWFVLGVIAIVLVTFEGAYRITHKQAQSTSHIKLDVGKLLLDGKEILVDLEKMKDQQGSLEAVGADLRFSEWFDDATNALEKTPYQKIWYQDKVILDYRAVNKSDYIEVCKRGLERLEYIKKLMFDKEDSQT